MKCQLGALSFFVLIFLSGVSSVQADPTPVRTLRVVDRETHLVRQFFGQVHAVETVDFAFEVSGRLVEVNAPEGGRLKAGTPLARIDATRFERAVRRTELALAQAERDLARVTALAERDVASDVQVFDARTARDLALVELEEAREALADTRITAPFDVLVADRLVAVQSMVESGQAVLRLHDVSEMRVHFEFPERLMEQVGALDQIRFEGMVAGREQPVPLEFREFRAEAGVIGQSYMVSLAVVDSVDAATLIPGRTMTVQANLPMEGGAPFFVPHEAITALPTGETIIVVVEEHENGLIARHVPVAVSMPGGDRIAVDGLTPGDEIVVAGAHLLTDGQPVVRFTNLNMQVE